MYKTICSPFHAFTLLVVLSFIQPQGFATVLGDVRGIVHDPDHRPVAKAAVTLHALASDYQRTGETNADGEFELSGVPSADIASRFRAMVLPR